jgi:hypothetical protein
MNNRLTLTVVAVALSATVCVVAQSPARRFQVRLPEGLGLSSQVLLIMKDVTVPRAIPATLRVYAVDKEARRLLGSYGLPAEAPDAQGTTTHPRLVVPILTGLRRAKITTGGQKLEILVEPVDGKGQPLRSYDWSAGEVTVEAR